VEAAKAHIRAKAEHPFRMIKHQFGFQYPRAAATPHSVRALALALLEENQRLTDQLTALAARAPWARKAGQARGEGAIRLSPPS